MDIIVTEDSATFRAILTRLLRKWGYGVHVARNGGEAWRLMQRPDAPALILLDWVLPDTDGIELCRRLRALNREPYAYIIMVTAHAEKRNIVAAMEAGADDYIIKPFDENELQVRIHAGRRIIELNTELIAAREAQRFLATHDVLTRVQNRRAIMEHAREQLASMSVSNAPFSVIMFDIDHFKAINDTYGHQMGDSVLREVAQRLDGVMDGDNAIGRFGGEEFLITLPAMHAETAMMIAEQYRAYIADIPVVVDDEYITVTASFGVATLDESRVDGLDSLIARADAALYRAKANGRNRVEWGETAETEQSS